MAKKKSGKLPVPFQEIETRHEFRVYRKRDLVLVQGKGSSVWDLQGREFLDCVTGMGAAILGHGHPVVMKALKQAETLITCSNLFYNDQRALFMASLANAAPGDLKRVFLCNSGAESVEAALKFARFSTGKTEFICARRGYHGRTMGALSATFRPDYREDFMPLVPGFRFAELNHFESFREQVTNETAAVLLEVVQGEGGVHPVRKEFLQDIARLCREKGLLLILDEVQTGMGRTGRLFGCSNYDVIPDMICLAKSMAGGIPMGAVIVSDRIEHPLGKHGSTFGGNPLACKVANEVLKYILISGFLDSVRKKSFYLMRHLTSRPLSRAVEIRGLGLLTGIQVKGEAAPLVQELEDQGVLALTAGPDVIRLLPPLTISMKDLERLIGALCKILA